ncbi:putative necrosis-inducing factor-domain-containing protein [Pseudoneurospora amorphoporcata]|uniref:Necrosis-inducing factor-domain-containing protein n=1 Tax=Pseudoneurospora amorphoporcata TaxID=241081 RepID=A0AAN6SIQ3_9PEZI|nr:putative necrosis-inducing factor-domain-containing protein [Pseudoneurospora amorphoporcata]
MLTVFYSTTISDMITQADQKRDAVFSHLQDIFNSLCRPALTKRLAWEDGAQYADSCGASTYVRKTTNASPLISDCAAIRDYYAQHNGRYVASYADRAFKGGSYCRLVITNTCVFGIKSDSFYLVNVGSRDISDLTRDSINKFRGTQRVGAEGHMTCHDDYSHPTSVDWALFTN